MEETNVAVSEIASQNSETSVPKAEKKQKGKASDAGMRHANPLSYTDPLQVKIVNCLMKNGKKTTAQRILRDTFDELYRLGEKDPLKTFETGLQNATPTVEVRAKRIGGAVYQIPSEVKPKRQQSLAIRWVLQSARSRKGQPMYRRLAQELIDASHDLGSAVNKKKEAHKMAQANKAFAHLARY